MGVLLTDKLRRAGVAPAVVPVALLSLAAIFAACSLQLWWAPRYLTPMTASVVLLAGAGAAALCQWKGGGLGGWLLVVLVIVTTAAAGGAEGWRAIAEAHASTGWWTAKRAVREQLLQIDGDDLVFVHYGPTHNTHIEWVYNGASIDRQPVVWAREIDPRSDAALRWVLSRPQGVGGRRRCAGPSVDALGTRCSVRVWGQRERATE